MTGLGPFGPAPAGTFNRRLTGDWSMIFETAMRPRWYFPQEDIRVELLDGDAHTVCAYKGHAT